MNETPSPATKPVIPLNSRQRRVIGVLVEKACCTPDIYPLTVNALQSGCNQKSNRDPVMDLQTHVVDETLLELQQLALVTRVMPATGRTERWRHNLKDVWGLDQKRRAVLAELLLRGAQSEGDLRVRASRMVSAGIETLEALREILDELARGNFVRRLSPHGQKRGVVWTHCLYLPVELERLEQRWAKWTEPGEADSTGEDSSGAESEPSTTALVRPHSPDLELSRRIETLEQAVASMQSQLDTFRGELAQLRRPTEG